MLTSRSTLSSITFSRAILRPLGVAALLALGTTAPATAASCWDLWYERNAIFASNGYCFSTSLGRRTFGNAGCWTKNPSLTSWERNRVAAIRREERARGCNVN